MRTLVIALILLPIIAFGQAERTGDASTLNGHNGAYYLDRSHHTGSGGGSSTWGSIIGTITSQSDLISLLNGKQPIDADLTAIAALSGTNTIYYRSGSNLWSPVTIGIGLTFSSGTLAANGGGGSSAWSDITGKPTTISGYGITDLNSLGDARWSLLAHTHTFSSLTSKPTTLSGYGITDAQPLDSDLTSIASLTTTSFGRSLLTQSDAAATRTTIGAGTGTVTSVGGTGTVSGLSITGTVTGAGNLTLGGTLAGDDTAYDATSWNGSTKPPTQNAVRDKLEAIIAGMGGVTSVTGTAPIASSGGTTPAISISAATTSAAGSMSASDKDKLDSITVGSAVWGGISGLMSDQTDLQTALDAKARNGDLATVAFSGAYTDLIGTPSIANTSLLLKGDGSGNAVAAIEGIDYYKPGGTDVAITDGGTGASTATGARTNLGAIDGSALNASNLSSGTVPDGRFPATLPTASGVNLTALNATNLGNGTVPLARLSGITTSQTTGIAASGANSDITSLSGTTSITGGATGLTLNGGGTNQDIILTPGGTGRVINSATKFFIGGASGYGWTVNSNELSAVNNSGSYGFLKTSGIVGSGRFDLGFNGAYILVAATYPIGWPSSGATGALDTAISRDSAGVIDVGTGNAGSTAGSWKATNGTLIGTLSVTGASTLTGGIVGKTDASNATAGNVGEYVSASVVQGSATALTTATPKTVTSISLTSGDWDITAIGCSTGASTGTSFDVAIGTTTNSFTGTVLGDTRCETPTVSLTGADASLMVPAVRVSISSTTTYYLIASETFTVGTPSAYGRISARRQR